MSLTRCLLVQTEIKEFIKRCMLAVGTNASHASSLADVLVEGDLRGHYSHGLNRMDLYVKEIQAGICEKEGKPVVEKESAATALVNGSNLLGPVVGNFCMSLALKKAQDVGIGWVVANGSNHYGIAGYYSMQALKKNMIGMCYTNTSPLVVPTRGKEYTLGTNPISVAAPAKDGDSFELDMATSAVALGKVELHARNGRSIPEGWGCDANGLPSPDPKAVLSGGGLVPVGGSEATGGYKGYGLALMVEVFCGILAGSHYSKYIRTWRMTNCRANLVFTFTSVIHTHTHTHTHTNTSSFTEYCMKARCFEAVFSMCATVNYVNQHRSLVLGVHNKPTQSHVLTVLQGQCFVALNPEFFADGFNDRMSDLLYLHRNLEPAGPNMPVMVPGDPERRHNQSCRELNGIPYSLSVVKHMNEVASTLGVTPLLPTHRLLQ